MSRGTARGLVCVSPRPAEDPPSRLLHLLPRPETVTATESWIESASKAPSGVFSGIVETTSPVVSVRERRGERIVAIRAPRGWRLREGESVCVSGVCSTVQKCNGRTFQVAYMPETLRKTTLGSLRTSDLVNMERSLTLASLIGGHLVQGHVDTTARIVHARADGDAKIYEFALPRRFSRYIVEKGSIAVDGVSLTVVDSRPGRFTVSLLPYTLAQTILGRKRPGGLVNIEVDILAKYLEKLVAA